MSGLLSAPDDGLLAAAALALALLALLVARTSPLLALAGWLAVLGLVPVWAGVSVGVFLQPQVAVGLLVLAALLPFRRSLPIALTAADAVLLAFVTSALVPVFLGGATLTSVFDLLVQWTGAFLVGRLVLHRVSADRVHAAVAVTFSVVAVLALVEGATGWNPFLSVPGSGALHSTWATVQFRGGLPRAEGAFGHSIALGGSLALAIPLTLAAPFRAGVRLLLVLLMAVACVLTFSRIGLGTAVLGVLLTVLAGRTGLTRRLRLALAAGLAAVAVAALPLVAGVFGAAGDEAAGSAAYRGDLLGLVGRMELLGLSDSFYRSPTGEVSFGSFRSIDSAFVLIGLTYGLIPLGCLLAGLTMAVVAVLRRRAAPPTLALVAQLPAFATVALITQYATWAWFVAGLAVAAQAAARDGRPQDTVPAARRASVRSLFVMTHRADQAEPPLPSLAVSDRHVERGRP
ncbi:hypothetical protein [Modestobacter sp. VKM Ac-2984]|uniref:hypothetical protein n=1 Tax=Modestobacter sp. VKM Ac-2984 TaxID=3004138 RepID=UPI0022AB0685|nr:hypothetical protein [Modestobacter sp. VKM Ac-2984]MCZ2817756.1 hypothetical protein [Modestobacter sp. VKM Ac-2984]